MSKKKRFGVSSQLSRGFGETIDIVEHHTGNLRNVIIPLVRVQVDPDNPRKLAINADDIRLGLNKEDSLFKQKEEELSKLNEIAQTIKSNGILNPITVYKHGDCYRIVAGERRYLASMLAGLNEIEARVYNDRPYGFDLKLVQWTENTAREDLNLKEKLGNIKDMVEAYKRQHPNEQINATWLHDITGLSLPQSSYYMTVLDAPVDVLEAIEVGHINNLDKAYMVAKIQKKELRAEAIRQCIAGMSFKNLKVFSNVKKNRFHRKNIEISLGSTKSANVIKAIMEAVLKTQAHTGLQEIYESIHWDDLVNVGVGFRKFISLLEKN